MTISNEIIKGELMIKVYGNHSLLIENHKGIHEYTNERIIVTSKLYQIHIHGQQLHIQLFSGVDMKIEGIINSIEYHLGDLYAA